MATEECGLSVRLGWSFTSMSKESGTIYSKTKTYEGFHKCEYPIFFVYNGKSYKNG
jgi:hypothetical protein